MRITIYVHIEDLENLNTAITALGSKCWSCENAMVESVRILKNTAEDYIETSISYHEYIKCNDLGIFEELLSL